MSKPPTTAIVLEVEEILDEAEHDPEGKAMLLSLIAAFDNRFGFTPSRRDFLTFLAEADNIAAQHTKAFDGSTQHND